MEEIFTLIEDITKRLSRPIKDLDDIRHAMGALKEIRDKEIMIDMSIGPIEVIKTRYLPLSSPNASTSIPLRTHCCVKGGVGWQFLILYSYTDHSFFTAIQMPSSDYLDLNFSILGSYIYKIKLQLYLTSALFTALLTFRHSKHLRWIVYCNNFSLSTKLTGGKNCRFRLFSRCMLLRYSGLLGRKQVRISGIK